MVPASSKYGHGVKSARAYLANDSNQISGKADSAIETSLRKMIPLLPRSFNDSLFDREPPQFIHDVLQLSALFNSTRPILPELLRNDCFQDIASRWTLYECVFQFIVALNNHPLLSPLLDSAELKVVDEALPLYIIRVIESGISCTDLKSEKCTPVRELVANIHRQAKAFIHAVSQQNEGEVSEEELEASTIAVQLISSIDHIVNVKNPSSTSSSTDTPDTTVSYVDACRKLCFDYYEGLEKQMLPTPKHSVNNNASSNQNQMNAKSNTLKIAQELAALSTNLPVSEATSVFLRVDEERLDKMQAIIVGPEGTPYENGLFLFDIELPPQYPQVAPRLILRTTGNGSVRFNPNLYNCGKVCLSLLGTWHGSPEEQWQPGKSTLLQVLLSIQSMIFVELPFFNEPGYGAPNPNNPQSKVYNAAVRVNTIKWAMNNMINHPPEAFKDVILTHFRMKRDYILQKQMPKWKPMQAQSPNQSLEHLIGPLEASLKQL